MPKKVVKKKAARPAKKKGPIKASAAIGVRKSSIHGKGVFARLPIAKNETVIEYKGEIMSEAEIDQLAADKII